MCITLKTVYICSVCVCVCVYPSVCLRGWGPRRARGMFPLCAAPTSRLVSGFSFREKGVFGDQKSGHGTGRECSASDHARMLTAHKAPGLPFLPSSMLGKEVVLGAGLGREGLACDR